MLSRVKARLPVFADSAVGVESSDCDVLTPAMIEEDFPICTSGSQMGN